MKWLAIAGSALCLVACSDAGTATDAAVDEAKATATSPSPADREEDIRHFLLQEYPEAAPMRYALAFTDLDSDGADEAIVYLVTPYFCGTGGCNTIILTPAGPMWRKVAEISVSRPPVTVMDSTTNGWKDITVAISGGGTAAGNALLRFDGTAYPGNPTVPPAEPVAGTGTEVIGAEPAFELLAAEKGSGS
ncbi:hypothetical protein WAB17_09760 [Parerythrobacter aurantius]|uniref:hypothetical protein n=1 Tax=Parerythrobacter aurantius TaxID=3127706 RepID=UPI003253B26B